MFKELNFGPDYDSTQDAYDKSRCSIIFAECVNKYGLQVSQKEYEDYVKGEIERRKDVPEKEVIEHCDRNKKNWMGSVLEKKAISHIIYKKASLKENFVTLEEIREFIKRSYPAINNFSSMLF